MGVLHDFLRGLQQFRLHIRRQCFLVHKGKDFAAVW